MRKIMWRKFKQRAASFRSWLNTYALPSFVILLFACNVYIFGLNKVYGVIDGYLKLILTTWPAVILLLGFWRKDVIDYLAEHLESLELFGAKAKINQSAPDQQIEERDIERAAKEVQKHKETGTSATPSEDNNEELKRKVIQLEQALLKEAKGKLFERIYRLIYGSQIRLLFDLNSKGDMNIASAAQYYMDAAVKSPMLGSYPYKDYINFLEKAGLVTVSIPFETGTITITEQGREFLRFLLDEKLDAVNKEN